MKKILILTTFFIFAGLLINSQEIPIKIIEKKGIVDIKKIDEQWKDPIIGDLRSSGTEIYTGLHSQLSLEIGNGSYITINQLTNITIDNVRIKQNEAVIEINLISGYLIVYSKKNASFNNKIVINSTLGNVIFNNSGGEVYLRKAGGAIIRSFMGKVSINPKIKTAYFILNGEMCGISSSGELIESDYFLRNKINVKPNDMNNLNIEKAYNQFLFMQTTRDYKSNDYNDNINP